MSYEKYLQKQIPSKEKLKIRDSRKPKKGRGGEYNKNGCLTEREKGKMSLSGN
jgi:hypothetical protein